ncbi:MAG: hypothetical protein ABI838_09010 [Chloroflexota bacterium]
MGAREHVDGTDLDDAQPSDQPAQGRAAGGARPADAEALGGKGDPARLLLRQVGAQDESRAPVSR